MNALELEQRIIGAATWSPAHLRHVVATTTADMFTDPKAKAARVLLTGCENTGLTTAQLAEVTSPDWAEAAVTNRVSKAELFEKVNELRAEHGRRRVQAIVAQHAGTMTAASFQLSVEAMIRDMQETMTSSATVVTERSGELDADWAEYAARKTIFTGLPEWDELCPLRGTELTVLGGRVSNGKSTLALQIARAAAKAGQTVVYVSLEMMASEQRFRLCGMETGISHERIANHTVDEPLLNEAELGHVRQVNERMKEWKLHFICRKVSVTQLLQIVGQAQADLVVVDHVQLMRAEQAGDHTAQLTEVMQGLKELAMNPLAGHPAVLALSQMRQYKSEPTLDDLYYSNGAEANNVFVISAGTDDATAVTAETPHEVSTLQTIKVRAGERRKRIMSFNPGVPVFGQDETSLGGTIVTDAEFGR